MEVMVFAVMCCMAVFLFCVLLYCATGTLCENKLRIYHHLCTCTVLRRETKNHKISVGNSLFYTKTAMLSYYFSALLCKSN